MQHRRLPLVFQSDLKTTSLDVGRIVEEDGELNASMSELWESVRMAVSRVKVGSCVVRWKDDQRIQELKDLELIARRQRGEGVALLLCLLSVPQDDFSKINATSVMSVRGRSANSPQRRGKEFLLHRPVVVSLVEVGAKIVTLEVGENIFHQERLVCWLLQRRKPTVVVVRCEERGG